MLAPVSADFMALCRLQLSLLVQGFKASHSVIYLAENWQDGNSTTLHPLLQYPEEAFSAPSRELEFQASLNPPLLLPQADPSSLNQSLDVPFTLDTTALERNLAPTDIQNHAKSQVVLPLVHEKFVMGLLTVERLEASWSAWERSQLEKIAQTIAISCLFDQQNQWLLQEQTRRGETDFLSMPQREMLDNLFHQLKSPVTAIRTFGKLLLKRLQAQDENRSVADRVIHETEHLQDLLQQVQQLLQGATQRQTALPSTVVTQPIPLLPSSPTHPLSGELCSVPCLIPDLLALPLASAAAIAQEQQQQLQVELIEPLPMVMADPKALREVVTNIIDNALKYTPQNGQISIVVFADLQGQYAPQTGESGVAIAISDTGPGIPTSDQSQLFQRHYRGQQAQGEIPGTGLGLAIAQDLMVNMRGQIKFWSPAHPDLRLCASTDSLGSTFLIWIPLAQNVTIV